MLDIIELLESVDFYGRDTNKPMSYGAVVKKWVESIPDYESRIKMEKKVRAIFNGFRKRFNPMVSAIKTDIVIEGEVNTKVVKNAVMKKTFDQQSADNLD